MKEGDLLDNHLCRMKEITDQLTGSRIKAAIPEDELARPVVVELTKVLRQPYNMKSQTEGLLHVLVLVDEDAGSVFIVELLAAKGIDNWIIDSAASQHMTAHRDLLVNYCEFSEPEPVALGDGHFVNAYGYGDINITILLGNKAKDQQKLVPTKVLYVPKLATNLLVLVQLPLKATWYNLDTPFAGLRTPQAKW